MKTIVIYIFLGLCCFESEGQNINLNSSHNTTLEFNCYTMELDSSFHYDLISSSDYTEGRFYYFYNKSDSTFISIRYGFNVVSEYKNQREYRINDVVSMGEYSLYKGVSIEKNKPWIGLSFSKSGIDVFIRGGELKTLEKYSSSIINSRIVFTCEDANSR